MLRDTGPLMALKNIVEYIRQKAVSVITVYAKAC